MKTKNVELLLREGTEVHGPDGWVKLLGDCTVVATLQKSTGMWWYQVKDDDWYVYLMV